MRVENHPILGAAPQKRWVRFSLDGQERSGKEGEPLAVALLASGDFALRRSPVLGQPRGVYCGIGRCSDCLMTVNEIPNVRSCVTPLAEGMRVERQHGLGVLPEAQPPLPTPAKAPFPECDLLVVGAGPAGLSAAAQAARLGVRAVIVDENEEPGGQLRKQIHKLFGPADFFGGVRGIHLCGILAEECRQAGAETLLGAVAFGVWPDGTVGVARDGRGWVARPKFVLVATGATENALAFPGWTLPGVMTAGAAQTVMNLHRVLPGRRVVIVGAGNVGLIVAYQFLQAGGEVAAVVEIGPRPGGYYVHADRITQEGVPLLTRHTLVRCEGEERVEEVVVAPVDAAGEPEREQEQVLEADAVCLAVGLSPSAELTAMAGARVGYLAALGGWVPLHDDNMRTTMPWLYVAGDAAGVEEVSAAMLCGRLAGVDIARRLGRADGQIEVLEARLRGQLALSRSGPYGEARAQAHQQVVEQYGKAVAG